MIRFELLKFYVKNIAKTSVQQVNSRKCAYLSSLLAVRGLISSVFDEGGLMLELMTFGNGAYCAGMLLLFRVSFRW